LFTLLNAILDEGYLKTIQMETFTALKSFVDNPEFHHQRKHSLKKLDFDAIDKPILKLMKDFAFSDICSI
jgi:hypothetical protein